MTFVLVLELLRYQTKKTPVRESAPLEIASATRGPSWHRWFYGVCASKEVGDHMVGTKAAKVKFGDMMQEPAHAGFGTQAVLIRKEKTYWSKVS